MHSNRNSGSHSAPTKQSAAQKPDQGLGRKKGVVVNIRYVDGTKDNLEVPVKKVGTFVNALVHEAVRLRRRDRATEVTIRT